MSKQNKSLIAFFMVGSWFTLLFLGKKKLVHYIPAAVMMSGIILLESKIAKKYKWWKIQVKLFKKLDELVPFIVGPFFVGSVWTLAFSFGNFPLYMLLNGIIDAFFSFPFYHWFRSKRVWKLIHLNEVQLWALMILKAVILYLLHWVTVTITQSKKPSHG